MTDDERLMRLKAECCDLYRELEWLQIEAQQRRQRLQQKLPGIIALEKRLRRGTEKKKRG